MQVGDLILLPQGFRQHWGLTSLYGLLVEKLPRTDYLQFDWKIFVDNRYVTAGRQIEDACLLENYLTKEKNKNNIPT